MMLERFYDFEEYLRAKVVTFVDSFPSLKEWNLDSLANDHPIAIGCVLICAITFFGNWLLNRKYPKEIRDKKKDYIIPIVTLIFTFALIGLSETFWPIRFDLHALSMLKFILI